MDREQQFLVSDADGLKLHAMTMYPDCEPKAIVQIAHGMSEYKERYIPFMEYLCSQGYVVVIHDHRGHGKSIKSAEDLGYFYENGAVNIVKDLHQVTKWIKKKYPDLPLILFGHSMGSLVSRVYLKKYDKELQGLIICGCPTENKVWWYGAHLSKLIRLVFGEHYRSRLLNAAIFGQHMRKYRRDGSANSWICANQDTVKSYDEDEKCGFIFTTNGFLNLTRLMGATYRKRGYEVRNKTLPIWFMSGADDPCMGTRTKFAQAIQLLQEVGYEHVTGHLYEGLRHELLNEKCADRIYEDVNKKITEMLKNE